MIKKLNNILHTPNWLFVLLIGILILRIPSFFEPYSYGDEMIYLSLGEAVRQGIPLYKEIHDNKPPLLYYTAALAGSLFWFKAILTIWHAATVYIFWLLATALFKNNEKLVKVATVLFALLTTLPLLEGNIVNSEMFMIGPTMLAFWLLLTKRNTNKNLLVAGGMFSVAILFKMPALFDIPAIVAYWLMTTKLSKSNLVVIGKKTLLVAVGVFVPIALTIIWYTFRGAFEEYLVAAFLQNVGYLSSFRPGDIVEPFLVRNGPLLLRAAVVLFGIMVLYLKRKNFSRSFLFIVAWLLFTLFAVTLSERPYPHYLLQSVAPLTMLLGILFTHTKKEQVFALIPLTLFFFVPFYYRFWHYPTIPYYLKFVSFATKQISLSEYRSTFGGETNRNYAIANYLATATEPKEKVFVWGNSSQIYALSRRLPPIRYVADYHIKDFSSQAEVVRVLEENPPSYIVILPNSDKFPEILPLLTKEYLEVQVVDGATIWKRVQKETKSWVSLSP